MAASSIPSFDPRVLLSQPQIHPIPYLRGQTTSSDQLSIIEAKIQEIMMHLEFPPQEDKARSFLERLQQTRELKSELLSLRVHTAGMLGLQSQGAVAVDALQFSPMSAKDVHKASRLIKVIDFSNHLSFFLTPCIIDASIEKTRSCFTHFQDLLRNLSRPQAEATPDDENPITSMIVDEVRLSLQEICSEVTEVNRGNVFSTAWQGPMIHYYQEIERAARAALAVLEKMNQKYDENLQRSFGLTSPILYVGSRLKETDLMIHQLYAKIGIVHPHATTRLTSAVPTEPATQPAAAAAAGTTEEPTELNASSPDDQTTVTRVPKRKASERFYRHLKKETASTRNKKPASERQRREKKKDPLKDGYEASLSYADVDTSSHLSSSASSVSPFPDDLFADFLQGGFFVNFEPIPPFDLADFFEELQASNQQDPSKDS
jgi:hypothetical protein